MKKSILATISMLIIASASVAIAHNPAPEGDVIPEPTPGPTPEPTPMPDEQPSEFEGGHQEGAPEISDDYPQDEGPETGLGTTG